MIQKKLKLKEDEDGNKTSSVNGIRAACKVMKTRYAKPFETVEIKIPYTTGMNPTSGLVEFFENQKLLVKDGNSLSCTLSDGTFIKKYRKEWMKNEDDALIQVMNDFDNLISKNQTNDETIDIENKE